MDVHTETHTNTSREGQGGADRANCLSPRIKWEVIFWGPKGRMENDKINECSFLSLLFLSSAPPQKKNDLPQSFCPAGWHNHAHTHIHTHTHMYTDSSAELFGPHCCWLCVIWWKTPPFQLLPLLCASCFISNVDAPYNHLRTTKSGEVCTLATNWLRVWSGTSAKMTMSTCWFVPVW